MSAGAPQANVSTALPRAEEACAAAGALFAEAQRLEREAACCEAASRAAARADGVPAQATVRLGLAPDEEATALIAAEAAGATERYSTGMQRARTRAADEVMASEQRRAELAERKRARGRRLRIAAAVCLAIAGAGAVAGVAWVQTGGFTASSQLATADVERLINSDADIMDGFAKNDYVEALPYRLVSATIERTSEEDGVTRVEASASIANGRFESSFTCVLEFVRAGELGEHPLIADSVEASGAGADVSASAWVGRVVEVRNVRTVAVAGIDYDDDLDGASFSPSFDREHQTCTFVDESTVDLWFATVGEKRTVSYRFDGERWVKAGAGDPVQTVTYRGLNGSYQPDSSGAQAFETLRIEDLDAEAGTFTLVYDKRATGLLGDDAVSGTISCAITREEATPSVADAEQEDGAVYTFEGTGTSSGGDGAASVSGVIGADYTIELDLAADYTRKPFLIGAETPDTLEVGGTFVK